MLFQFGGRPVCKHCLIGSGIGFGVTCSSCYANTMRDVSSYNAQKVDTAFEPYTHAATQHLYCPLTREKFIAC